MKGWCRFVILFVLGTGPWWVQGQNLGVEVTYQINRQGAYEFYGNNRAFCNYILTLRFTQLQNGHTNTAMPFEGELTPGNHLLFTLSRDKKEDDIVFKYQMQALKGCLQARPAADYVYLLPLAEGKETQAYTVEQPGMGAASPTGPGTTLRFKMKPGDTIYAVRGGRVSEVNDQDSVNDTGRSSPGKMNTVEVVHPDCSFAEYGILRKGSALVKPGQWVQPGTPIGLVGGDRYGRGSEIVLGVWYNLNLNAADASQSSSGLYRQYLPLTVWTKFNGKGSLKNGATYISEWPKDLLRQGMDTKAAKPKPAKSGAK